MSFSYSFDIELIAKNRFNSKDPSVRNTLLSLASIFGTRNLSNALELLDSATSSNYKQQRWKKYGTDNVFPESDSLVTEFVACSSQRSLLQVITIIGAYALFTLYSSLM